MIPTATLALTDALALDLTDALTSALNRSASIGFMITLTLVFLLKT